MGRSKREKPLTNAEREKRWHEKNPGSHKKELQQRRENNKKEAKTIWKWDHRVKSNWKRKENQGKTSRLCGEDRKFREPSWKIKTEKHLREAR